MKLSQRPIRIADFRLMPEEGDSKFLRNVGNFWNFGAIPRSLYNKCYI